MRSRSGPLVAASVCLTMACGSSAGADGPGSTPHDDAGAETSNGLDAVGDVPSSSADADADADAETGATLPACTLPFDKRPEVTLGSASPGGIAVAWNGAQYGALYTTGSVSTPTLVLQRLDPAGALVGAPSTVVAWSTSARVQPNLGLVGTDGFEAIWNTEPGGIDMLFGTAISAAGVVAGSATSLGSSSDPLPANVAWSGSSFLAAASSIGVLHGWLVPAAGTATELVTSDWTASGESLAYTEASGVIWTGDRFAVATRTWTSGPGGTTKVAVAELGLDGKVTGVTEVWEDVDVKDAAYGGQPAAPSLSWSGSEYHLAWAYAPDLLVTASLTRGATTATVHKAPLAAAVRPSAPPIWDGVGYGGIVDASAGSAFVRYAADGTVNGAPIPLGSGQAMQVIWSGREYAVGLVEATRHVFVRLGSCP